MFHSSYLDERCIIHVSQLKLLDKQTYLSLKRQYHQKAIRRYNNIISQMVYGIMVLEIFKQQLSHLLIFHSMFEKLLDKIMSCPRWRYLSPFSLGAISISLIFLRPPPRSSTHTLLLLCFWIREHLKEVQDKRQN